MRYNKKLSVEVGCLLLTCSGFWFISRYPDLNLKALHASSGAGISDLISMWPLLEISENDTFLIKILKSSINWLHGNLRGMIFGTVIGGMFLGILKNIRLPAGHSTFRGILMGILMGVPLGVCVNCAAPVFKGISLQKRQEAGLAAMFSSPTLNIIVLTMIFSLFPFYMGIIRILYTLFVLFLLIPLLSRLFRNEKLPDASSLPQILRQDDESCTIDPEEQHSWFDSFKEAGKEMISGIWFILIRTAPWMLLAAICASVISRFIPQDLLQGNGGYLFLAATSVIALLIPLPIAFDIVLVSAFYRMGMNPAMAVILLCQLSIFSLYAWMILWTSGLKRYSLGIVLYLSVAGFLTALPVPWLHRELHLKPSLASYRHESGLKIREKTTDKEHSTYSTRVREQYFAVSIDEEPATGIKAPPMHQVLRTKFQNKSEMSDKNGPLLRLAHADETGLTHGFKYGVRDYPDPFWLGRGTASGDFNQDGWDDLLLGSSSGPVLYLNSGGKYKEKSIGISALEHMNVYGVAFTDMNNDQWPDIFITTFMKGNFIILNNKGKPDKELISVPNNEAVITVSPAFADFQQDGYPDVFNGNMALGVVTGSWEFTGKGRANSITMNKNLYFSEVDIPGVSGETMTSFVSDINVDGHPDLYQGNDFIVRDWLLFGANKPELFSQESGLNYPGYGPFFSMGADSGDLNNDGLPDLVITGTLKLTSRAWEEVKAKKITPPSYYFKSRRENCSLHPDPAGRQRCVNNVLAWKQLKGQIITPELLQSCQNFPDEFARDHCLLNVMWSLLLEGGKHWDCKKDFEFDQNLQQACEVLSRKGDPVRSKSLSSGPSLPQKDQSFVYLQNKEGVFTDVNQLFSESFNHPGGWTWNVKIADLDNDGWQDIINSQGAIQENPEGWNLLFTNRNGKHFPVSRYQSNLATPFSMFSFTLTDLDFDGDLDIVGNSSDGPVLCWKNLSTGPSLAFQLKDNRGNFFGLGAKITVYNKKGNLQFREIKASGGYLSQDSPKVYFGLGKTFGSVDSVKVVWPDGKASVFRGAFKDSYLYTLVRNSEKKHDD